MNDFEFISIHKALASLDGGIRWRPPPLHYFNPQGSREPRLERSKPCREQSNFNPQGSREPRRLFFWLLPTFWPISIHKALASLDQQLEPLEAGQRKFQSTRLSRASTASGYCCRWCNNHFNPQGSREPRLPPQSLKLLIKPYFNPQGSREPRQVKKAKNDVLDDFNPQGSREPRRLSALYIGINCLISIHKALASLDMRGIWTMRSSSDFNPQGSREPRLVQVHA